MITKLIRKFKIINKLNEISTKAIISNNVRIELDTKVINDGKKNNISIAQNCVIKGTLYASESGKIIIGNNCLIGKNTLISSTNEIKIGDNCLISWDCTIQDNNSHPVDYKKRLIQIERMASQIGYYDSGKAFPMNESDSEKIIIGDNVWIGLKSIVLKGVSIGDNSVIGAGSVVTRDIPKNSIAVGNPAKVIKVIK